MSEGFRLRIRYEIGGRLAHLSHLETIRSMERVVRRASLPFAITEGFNPHMKVAFGPALPVGAGSVGEYLDLRLNEYVPPEQALAALRAAAPENLMPTSCAYVGLQDDAIDVAYPVSVWEARLGCGEERLSDLQNAFDALLERGYIEIVKRKRGKEDVKRVEFENKLVEAPVLSVDGDVVSLRFATKQEETGALRPDKLIAAALDGLEDAPPLLSLTRVELRGA